MRSTNPGLSRRFSAPGEPGRLPGRQRIELTVTLAGSRALKFLNAPAPGRVLHVFDNSAYLENETGALACIGGPIIGAAPLNAMLNTLGPFGGKFPHERFPGEGFPGWRFLLEEGDPLSFDGENILVGNHVALACHEIRPWRPESPALPIRPHLLAVHLEALRSVCSAGAPAGYHGGLGFLLTRHSAPAAAVPVPAQGSVARSLADRAGLALGALEGWLRRSLPVEDVLAAPPTGEAAEEAAGLIGLGPGLTPSGDDLIGGMLIALHAIGRPGLADALGRWAVPLARARSTRISLAHLSAACEGEGAASLHGVLNGLGRDPDWTPDGMLIDPFFQGHSSGWDALAGIIAVMSAFSTMAGRGKTTSPRGVKKSSAPVSLLKLPDQQLKKAPYPKQQ